MDSTAHPKRSHPTPTLSPPTSASVSVSSSMDSLLDAFIALSASAPDPAAALDAALDRLLAARACDADRDLLAGAAARAGAALAEAAARASRRRAAAHNAAAWPLPADLTVKVMSLLDTRTLCYAAASCAMFYKCAVDPLCYANIDLTAAVPKVSNAVVSTMIQRAGKNLRSLKLGIWPCLSSALELSRFASSYCRNVADSSCHLSNSKKRSSQDKDLSTLTRSCLVSLSMDGGAAGALLRKLHLYHIDKMDNVALRLALSVCQSLVDLEIIGLYVELKHTLTAVGMYCHSVERLSIESPDIGRDDSLKSSTCHDLVKGCPNLAILALRGFKLHDHKLRILLKGFPNLKIVDFSTSLSITGSFLRLLGSGFSSDTLEVLNLCDCLHLKEVEVSMLILSMLDGDWKHLSCVDISNKDGLSADDDWNCRYYNPCPGLISQLLKQRPELCFVAEFPQEGSFIDVENPSDSETSSDGSLLMYVAPVGPYSPNFYESYFFSDLGTGNEDLRDIIGSDEMDFQF